MKKYIKLILVVSIIIIICGCGKNNKINDKIQFNDLANPKIVEQNKNYKIYSADNFFNYYYIYNNKGQIVKEGGYNTRIPEITMIDDNLLRFNLQTGTGASTALSFYYDVQNDVLSKDYYCVLDDYDNILIYCDTGKLIVQNIFDKSKTYIEITKFKEQLSEQVVEPFINAKFISRNKITITYLTNSNKEVTETIDVE